MGEVAPAPGEGQAHHHHGARGEDRGRKGLAAAVRVACRQGRRPRDDRDEQQERDRPFEEAPVDRLDRGHHSVMLDPQHPEDREGHAVGNVGRPGLQQVMRQVRGGLGPRQVEDEQGHGDGKHAVDRRVQASWAHLGTSSAGASRRARRPGVPSRGSRRAHRTTITGATVVRTEASWRRSSCPGTRWSCS